MGGSADLLAAVGDALGDRVVGAEPTGGGSINLAARLDLASGNTAFLKHRSDAEPNEFPAEAAGLAWLGAADAPRVPAVLALGEQPQPWLALEWIEPGQLNPSGAEGLGRGLARLHRLGATGYGALPPGSPDAELRIGSVALPLPRAGGVAPAPTGSVSEPRASTSPASIRWSALYVERLILPLVRMALDRGAIDNEGAAGIERCCRRIEGIAGPEEPPARLHGDLWGGNVLADSAGNPCLIDPAAYGGHREIDLAMLRLFGTPGGDRVFGAYEEEWPLADGHQDRVALWQLLPLLIHAVLFGGSYGNRAVAAARLYL